MNREAFYREIGYIDDDLIEAANEAPAQKHKKPLFFRLAKIAACFCLICTGMLLWLRQDTVFINQVQAPPSSKLVIPAGENTKTVPMTYTELLVYYGMTALPDSLGGDLTRTDQTYFVLYQDQAGNVIFDTNIFYYNSIDASKTLSISLSKAKDTADTPQEGIRQSQISGVPVLLTASSTGAEPITYLAEFKLNGITIKMIFEGLNEDEFINTTKEFIRLLK